MKKFALLMVLVLFLFTACSSAPGSSDRDPSVSKLDLEELTDNVYVDYDRTKYENVSAPPTYYAQYIKPDDSALASLFVNPPKIYDDEERHERVFENEHEHGYYWSHGGVDYRTDDGLDIYEVSRICLDVDLSSVLDEDLPSVKELDFMSLDELYKKFDEDIRKFIDNYEIFEMTAVTVDIFEEITTHYENHSGIEKVWCEPKDIYYIRARQFVNDIPIFRGRTDTEVETVFRLGSQIEAGYTKNGLEYFSVYGGYRVGEERPADGEFIDLKGAEQLIRDYYTMPYGPIYERLYDCALVYVAVFEGDKTVLTPAWDFYFSDDGIYEERPWGALGSPAIRINAYTGEFMQ